MSAVDFMKRSISLRLLSPKKGGIIKRSPATAKFIIPSLRFNNVQALFERKAYNGSFILSAAMMFIRITLFASYAETLYLTLNSLLTALLIFFFVELKFDFSN